MLWDTHLHSHFSGDSDAAPEDIIAAAQRKGLSGICFTDHLDLDYPKEPDLFLLDFDSYFQELSRLAKSCRQSLPVGIGLELGLQPHLANQHRKLLDSHPFDFVIGSSHVVHGMDPYYPEYYDNKTEDLAYEEYFTSILENISAFSGFDVYGHLDYVVRYGPNQNRFYSYEKFRDILDAILTALIEKGKGIEINTGGFKYGLGHPNPTQEILKRYHELGGEIITLGSDAHTPAHVAYDFHRLPSILKEAGFSYFTVFKKRKPEFIRLP